MRTPGLDFRRLRVAVLGPGAVGGFMAAVLHLCGIRVLCIGTAPTVRAIQKNGIRLTSETLGEHTVPIHAVKRLGFHPDWLIIAVKAPFLDTALAGIDPPLMDRSVVISVMNGFDHISRIRARLGKRLVVGMISIEVTREDRHRVIHRSKHAGLEIASDGDVAAGKLQEIAAVFRASGIHTNVLANEAQVIWNKLARLNAIAVTTAACQQPVGFVRTDTRWRQDLTRCIEEAAGVAALHDVHIDVGDELRKIDSFDPQLSSSLQRDISHGIRSELDAIPGAVIREANRNGLACPTIESLTQRIQESSGENWNKN